MSGILLETFVDTAKITDCAKFSGRELFSCLGEGLREIITDMLITVGVRDTPVIHGTVEEGAVVRGPVYVAKGALVEAGAMITGPCWLAPGAEVRHAAYLRGNVYLGPGAVAGHTTEVKGAILFDGAKASHFAYVGDAILGRNVNLGAGTKLANLPLRRGIIRVLHPETGRPVSTGLHKFSAVMGDGSQTGCNAVLSPGTLLLPGTSVWPCVHYRGTLTSGQATGR